MNINRRSFLTAAVAALVLDPERLLWVPGKKVYSIPKPEPKTFILALHPITKVDWLSIDGHVIPVENFFFSFPDRDPTLVEITRVTIDPDFEYVVRARYGHGFTSE